jgi:hypothetical protein
MRTVLILIIGFTLIQNINAQGVEKIHLDFPEVIIKTCTEGDCENGNGKANYELKAEFTPKYTAVYSGKFKDGKPHGEGWLFIVFPFDQLQKVRDGEEARLKVVSIEGVFDDFTCDGNAKYGTASLEGENEKYTYSYSGKTLLGVPQKRALGKTLGSWKSTIDVIKTSPAFAVPDSVKITYKNNNYYLGNSHGIKIGIPGAPGVYYGNEYKVIINSQKYTGENNLYTGEIVWKNNNTFNGNFILKKYQLVNGELEFIPVKGEIKYANGKTHTGEFDSNGLPKLLREEDASNKLYKMAVRMFSSGKNEKGCALLQKAYKINSGNEDVNNLIKSKCH